jgi:hypothetical protein
MSAEDAKFYGSLLRDDFDLVRKSAGTSYPVLKGPLDAASPRIKRWSKEIEKEIKGRQADAALVAFRRLDVEIQRTIALFPADALPPEIASLYDTADSDVVGEDAGEAQSVGADIPSVYACPMHPEVTSTTPGNCPKCGMNLAKSGQ